ncbi:MAG: hypothetical protein LBK18_10500 [Prevotellaceae bacterium]|jgi:hypothetical protein|nr:hypothetical protein [Prevotellaceae bacterium]
MDATLKDYREAVEFLAKNRVDNLIFNAGDEHAQIIFQNIFKNCEGKIRLLAGNLQNEVTKSAAYLDALKGFLQRDGSKLEVMLDNFARFSKQGEVEVFKVLLEYRDKVAIKSTDTKFYVTKVTEGGAEEKVPVHFCTGNAMYRLEIDTRTRSARCNFNDKSFVEDLNTLFDEDTKKGREIAWNEVLP